MFSFHKPKVYRSTQGCCICKAKSSSSRFTDSKKYELDFIDCFQLETPRQGEICNACVLLVKRFKRLPPDSDRNWGHVVDARVGPGLKSMTKFKKRKEELAQQQNGAPLPETSTASGSQTGAGSHQSSGRATSSASLMTEKFSKIFRKTKAAPKAKLMTTVPADKDVSSDDTNSPTHIIDYDNQHKNAVSNLFCHERLDDIVSLQSRPAFKRSLHKTLRAPIKNYRRTIDATLFTADAWTKVRTTCCGSVYENRTIGALLLNTAHSNGACPTCCSTAVTVVAPSPPPVVVETTTVTAKIVAAPLMDARTISLSAMPAGRIFPNGGAIAATGARTIKINGNAMVLVQKRRDATTSNVGKVITIKAAAAAAAVKSPLDGSGAAVAPKEMMHILNKNTMIEATNGHKFNDNSSDSGYDEMLHEPNANKLANTAVRSLVLPSGLKLHVQPQSSVTKVQIPSTSNATSTGAKIVRPTDLLATPGAKTTTILPVANQMAYLNHNKIIKIKVGHP